VLPLYRKSLHHIPPCEHTPRYRAFAKILGDFKATTSYDKQALNTFYYLYTVQVAGSTKTLKPHYLLWVGSCGITKPATHNLINIKNLTVYCWA